MCMATNPTALQIRPATPEDFSLVDAWAIAHGRVEFWPQMVSPTSWVVEDEDGPMVFCGLYLAVGCGVAFLDGFFSRPGQTASKVLEGMEMLVKIAEEVCRTHDYGILIGHTSLGVARYARSLGFTLAASGIAQVGKEVQR